MIDLLLDIELIFLVIIRIVIIVMAAVIFIGYTYRISYQRTIRGQAARWIFQAAWVVFIAMNIYQATGAHYDVHVKLMKYGSVAYILSYVAFMHAFIWKKKL